MTAKTSRSRSSQLVACVKVDTEFIQLKRLRKSKELQKIGIIMLGRRIMHCKTKLNSLEAQQS